jgi:hypothetical protein
MGILIGMDEAGYGPNFGPLVVAATVWEVEEEVSGVGCRVSVGRGKHRAENGRLRIGDCGLRIAGRPTQSTIRNPQSEIGIDLYARLRNIVAKSASERRIAIADSKTLYNPGTGLRQLERGVHAVLLSLQAQLQCWSSLVRFCEADPDNRHQKVCWPDGFDCNLPVDATCDELSRLAVRFTRACDSAGIKAIAIRARLVYPAQFNELVDYYGSKGAALSHITVGLLREMIDFVTQPDNATAISPAPSPQSLVPIYAVCDKHGGRNYYTALLQHHFSEHWIEPVFESHSESRYEWGPPEARVRTHFRMNGERFLPTALASMTAKYLRELAMRAFNEFWCARVPNLQPTAGYPTDSHRFRRAVAAAQRELGIEDHDLWRNR